MANSKPATAKKPVAAEKKPATRKVSAAKPIKLGGVPNQGTVSKAKAVEK